MSGVTTCLKVIRPSWSSGNRRLRRWPPTGAVKAGLVHVRSTEQECIARVQKVHMHSSLPPSVRYERSTSSRRKEWDLRLPRTRRREKCPVRPRQSTWILTLRGADRRLAMDCQVQRKIEALSDKRASTQWGWISTRFTELVWIKIRWKTKSFYLCKLLLTSTQGTLSSPVLCRTRNEVRPMATQLSRRMLEGIGSTSLKSRMILVLKTGWRLSIPSWRIG